MKETDLGLKKCPGKYAWTVRIGEKGQFVIPKEARDLFGLHPGDTIILLGDIERGLAIPPQAQFAEMTQKVFGGKEND